MPKNKKYIKKNNNTITLHQRSEQNKKTKGKAENEQQALHCSGEGKRKPSLQGQLNSLVLWAITCLLKYNFTALCLLTWGACVVTVYNHHKVSSFMATWLYPFILTLEKLVNIYFLFSLLAVYRLI